MKIRYLLDENLTDADIIPAILRHDPTINVVQSGDATGTPSGMDDETIWRWCETHQRLLVTNNRKTMPQHLRNHYARQGTTWGIFILSPTLYQRDDRVDVGALAIELYTIWFASAAEEWQNAYEWIPL